MNYNNNDLFIGIEVPKSLKEEELNSYFAKYKAGDLTARETIINGNIRLVLNQVLSKYYWSYCDKNDLVEVGLIGLIKSVDTFDISKNLKFATYAVKCINNEILLFMIKSKKYINDVSIDEPLRIDEYGEEIKILDILSDESVDFVFDYEKKEIYLAIRNLVDELAWRDREVIMMYFGFETGEPLSQKEIANRINVSQSYVSKIIIRSLKIIRFQLIKLGLVDELRDSSKILKRENEISR